MVWYRTYKELSTKKGIKRASADVGFMFIAYNLRRLMNIVDKNAFIKFLKELGLLFLSKMALLRQNIFKMNASILHNELLKHFYWQ